MGSGCGQSLQEELWEHLVTPSHSQRATVPGSQEAVILCDWCWKASSQFVTEGLRTCVSVDEGVCVCNVGESEDEGVYICSVRRK